MEIDNIECPNCTYDTFEIKASFTKFKCANCGSEWDETRLKQLQKINLEGIAKAIRA